MLSADGEIGDFNYAAFYLVILTCKEYRQL